MVTKGALLRFGVLLAGLACCLAGPAAAEVPITPYAGTPARTWREPVSDVHATRLVSTNQQAISTSGAYSTGVDIYEMNTLGANRCPVRGDHFSVTAKEDGAVFSGELTLSERLADGWIDGNAALTVLCDDKWHGFSLPLEDTGFYWTKAQLDNTQLSISGDSNFFNPQNLFARLFVDKANFIVVPSN